MANDVRFDDFNLKDPIKDIQDPLQDPLKFGTPSQDPIQFSPV